MEQPDSFGIKQIEQYLNGELKGEKLKAFEDKLETDMTLVKRVEDVKKMPDQLFTIEKERLSNQVKNWMQEKKEVTEDGDNPTKSPSLFSGKNLIIVAVLIALLIAAGMWYFASPKQNLEKKTQVYFAMHYQNPVVLRGELDDSWKRAIQHYTKDEFGQMVNQMTPWIIKEGVTIEQELYYALANMYKEPRHYDIALEYFRKIELSDTSTYSEVIAWNRALIYLDKKDIDKAKAELLKLKSSRQYSKEATELLNEMER